MDIVALFERFGPWIAILIIGVVTWSRDQGMNDKIVSAYAATNATLQESVSKIAETMTQRNIALSDRNALLEKLLSESRENEHQLALQMLEIRGTLTDTVLTLGQREKELYEAQEANSALRAARDELGAKFATLSTNVGEITSRIEDLETRLSKEQEHSAALEDRQNKMEAELAEAKRLRKEAEKLNRELTAERDRLMVENQAQAELIEQYASRLTAFEEENRQLRERLTELEVKIERMNHVTESDEMVGAGDGTAGDGDVGGGGLGAG